MTVKGHGSIDEAGIVTDAFSSIIQSKSSCRLDPIRFRRARSRFIPLEIIVTSNNPSRTHGTSLKMALDKIHAPIIDGGNGRGIIHRSSLGTGSVTVSAFCRRGTGTLVGSTFAVRTSDANLVHEHLSALALRRGLSFYFACRKNLVHNIGKLSFQKRM